MVNNIGKKNTEANVINRNAGTLVHWAHNNKRGRKIKRKIT